MKVLLETPTLLGILLILICLFVRYLIGKRRFDRRGITGLHLFDTYHKYMVVNTLEKIALFLANLCGFAGCLLLAVVFINHFKF